MHTSIRLLLFLSIIGCSLCSLQAQIGLKCLQNLTISTSKGETTSTKCSSSDGTDSEVIRFRTNTAATPIGFLIVNDQNIIIHQTTNPFINFTAFPEASLKVYAFSFLGNLNSNIGTSLSSATLATRCFELSKNYIQVSNTPLDGGTLVSDLGLENQIFCHGDGRSDLVEIAYQSEGIASSIFITNQEQQVVYVGGDTIIDFEKLAVGTYTIRGITYSGSLLLEKGAYFPADNRLATGCFGLAPESITVENILPSGGQISSVNGDLPITVCRYPDSVNEELVTFFVSGQSNQPYAFILVNEEDIIEAISNDGIFDLKNLPRSTKKVYGISFPSNLPYSIGQKWDPSLSEDGCTGVSTNYLEIFIPLLSPGSVSNSLNSDTLFYCAAEEGEMLMLTNDFDPTSGTVKYLITDQNDHPILNLLSNQVNTRLFPEGEFHIWAVQYRGALTLDYSAPVTEQSLSTQCFRLSNYPLVVFKYESNSFEIAMTNGSFKTFLCPNEGFPDIVSFGPIGAGTNLLQYAVLDSEGMILAQTNNQVFNFSDYADGNYRLIGVSYLGIQLDVTGQHIDTALFSTECFTQSTNQIAVEIGTLEAGPIELVAPEDGQVNSCNPWLEADFTQDFFPSEISKAWVLVDVQENIAAVVPEGPIDWSPYPAGTYQLYGLVYSGDLIVQIGENFAAHSFSNDCFSLSNQAITVDFSRPEGGELPKENRLTCSSNPESILVLSSNPESASALENVWVIINLPDNQVVEITDKDTIRSANYPEGDYQIKRLSYLVFPEGLNIGASWEAVNNDSSACYDWSTGELTWKNTEPVAPQLSFSDQPNAGIDSICVLKNNRYIISLNQSFDSDYFHRIIITNDSLIILDADAGLQPDFSAYDSPHILIHSIASLSPLSIQVGDSLSQIISLTEECLGVAEVLEVVKTEVGGGRLTTDWAIDSDTLLTCLQDGIPDWITIEPVDHSTTASYTLLIANAEDQILGKLSNPTRNYDNNIFGELRIYGISHEGPLDFSVGAPISSVKVAGDCYEWAEQYITVISDQVDGGTITSSFGEDYFDYCGDGSQQLELQTNSTSNVGYAYLLWGADSTIQRISWKSSMPIDGLTQGIYQISAVSYTGIWNLLVGDPISAIPTDGCYEWAANTLQFNLLGEVDAGTIHVVGYETDTIYTCPGNGSTDIIELAYTSKVVDGLYAFMLTDQEDTILYPSIPTTGLLNFENAPEGIYKAYGISYTGQLNGQANRDIRTLELSNECYAWTPQPIVIINQVPIAGEIYAVGYDEETLFTYSCDTSRTPESWSFYFKEKLGFSAFIITNAAGGILASIEAGIPFEIPNEYACQSLTVTGVAYTGTLPNLEGLNINQLNLDQCYALSTNQLTLLPSEGAQLPPSDPFIIQTTYNTSNILKTNPVTIENHQQQQHQPQQLLQTPYPHQPIIQSDHSFKIYPNPVTIENHQHQQHQLEQHQLPQPPQNPYPHQPIIQSDHSIKIYPNPVTIENKQHQQEQHQLPQPPQNSYPHQPIIQPDHSIKIYPNPVAIENQHQQQQQLPQPPQNPYPQQYIIQSDHSFKIYPNPVAIENHQQQQQQQQQQLQTPYPHQPIIQPDHSIKIYPNPVAIENQQQQQQQQQLQTPYPHQPIIQSDHSFKIYPNPVAMGQSLNIEFLSNIPKSIGERQMFIYDITGRKMMDKRIDSSEKRVEIKLGKLPKGIYLIDIWNNNQRLETKQLLVQ